MITGPTINLAQEVGGRKMDKVKMIKLMKIILVTATMMAAGSALARGFPYYCSPTC
jgi:hypothetical protein